MLLVRKRPHIKPRIPFFLSWIQADVNGDAIPELVMNRQRGGDARPPEDNILEGSPGGDFNGK